MLSHRNTALDKPRNKDFVFQNFLSLVCNFKKWRHWAKSCSKTLHLLIYTCYIYSYDPPDPVLSLALSVWIEIQTQVQTFILQVNQPHQAQQHTPISLARTGWCKRTQFQVQPGPTVKPCLKSRNKQKLTACQALHLITHVYILTVLRIYQHEGSYFPTDHT